MKYIIRYLIALLFISFSSLSQAEIVLKDLEGNKTALSSLKGKWVFVNYWAGWCRTCVAEIPELNRFYQSHQNDAVVLYGVNFDAPPLSEQKNVIKQLDIHYPNLIKDPADDLGIKEIIGLPVTFIFNPEGILVKTLYGGQTLGTLNQVMANSH
jgi:thiol-disulfide isomerase/thioredoxin